MRNEANFVVGGALGAEAGRGWRKCVNLVPLRRMMPVSPCCYIKDMERMIPRRENLGTVLEWIRK